MLLFTWSGRESELVSEPKDSVHVLQELHAACHLGLETATFVVGLKNALVCKHSGTHVVWQHILINAMYYRAELGTYLGNIWQPFCLLAAAFTILAAVLSNLAAAL